MGETAAQRTSQSHGRIVVSTAVSTSVVALVLLFVWPRAEHSFTADEGGRKTDSLRSSFGLRWFPLAESVNRSDSSWPQQQHQLSSFSSSCLCFYFALNFWCIIVLCLTTVAVVKRTTGRRLIAYRVFVPSFFVACAYTVYVFSYMASSD